MTTKKKGVSILTWRYSLAEVFKMVLSEPTAFVAAVILLFAFGISINIALQPFNHPRDIYIDSEELEEEE